MLLSIKVVVVYQRDSLLSRAIEWHEDRATSGKIRGTLIVLQQNTKAPLKYELER